MLRLGGVGPAGRVGVAAVCLSGPGVCVILAVCQSGLGNGHGVITPALTASSISLYHSSTSPPSPLAISFHPLLQKEVEKSAPVLKVAREKKTNRKNCNQIWMRFQSENRKRLLIVLSETPNTAEERLTGVTCYCSTCRCCWNCIVCVYS